MADFFQDDTTVQEVEKIKVGEKEYTQDELNTLVGLGEIAQDVETRYNTKIDRVYPEFTKSQQKLKGYESELEELRKLKESNQNKPQAQWTDEQKALVKQQLQDVLGGEVVTNKQLEEWYSSRRSGERLLEESQELEGEIDGLDGRPKFKTEEILQHMQETGIRNPMKAYKDKYEPELDKWREGELLKAKPNGMVTQMGSNSGKQPVPVKVTKENLEKLMSEALYGAQE